MSSPPIVPQYNETGLCIEQSHQDTAVWVPLVGTVEGYLNAGTLAQAKAYVQSTTTDVLHWTVDKSGQYTRCWAWTVT